MIRTRIANYAAAAMFLFLGAGLFNMQVLHGRDFKAKSEKNCIRLLPQWGARGSIYDRSGNLLVTNKLSYDLMLLAQDEDERGWVLGKAAGVLGENLGSLEASYRKNYIGISLPVLVKSGITREQAIALEELRNDIPSIIVQPRPVRSYPQGNLCCHVLGYLNQIDRWRLTKLEDYGYKTKDIVGFGGVEEKYDYYLRQEEGGLSFEVDHRGKFVRTVGFKPPINGRDIGLTLDLRIQRIVEKSMEGKTGAVVIMEPHTGEIFAMSSSPGFDPAMFNNGIGKAEAAILDDPNSPLVNRVISFAYPPGSVFKPVVAAAALEAQKAAPGTTFVCKGSTQIGKKKFECWSTHGPQDLRQALEHSCNVYFYRTGLILGAGLIHDWAVRFGFSKASGVDLPYEENGFMPSPRGRRINKFKSWFSGDTANISIGQGEVLATPLQIARMTAVFANGGYLVEPYLARSIGGSDISLYRKKAAAVKLNRETLEQIREGLRDAVRGPKGTAHMMSELSVTVAGKTGTAQAPPGAAHAWFCGFFPYERPEYVICVFVERGGSGTEAVVVSKHIISKMIDEGVI